MNLTPHDTAFQMIQDILTCTLGLPSVSNKAAERIALVQVRKVMGMMEVLNHPKELEYYQQVESAIVKMNL